jgi:hypothetical protein
MDKQTGQIKLITYRHSGTLGDTIYALAILPIVARGKFLVAINNIDVCISKFGYAVIDPAHVGRYTEQDYEWLKPLLERQPYIEEVGKWYKGDPNPDVDLDDFRAILFRGFRGNYIEAYHRTFQLPFDKECMMRPWLACDPERVAPIVVSRTSRYHGGFKDGINWHKELAKGKNLKENGIFIGSPKEHQDYCEFANCDIKYYPVRDFLHMTNVIAGADLFIGNQTFAYSLAMGTNTPSILETMKQVPLQLNECYFPRTNCEYF